MLKDNKLQNLQIVRKNQRYCIYSASYLGEKVFVKEVLHHNLGGAIQQELWGIQAFKQIAAATDLGFEIPEVVDFDSDVLITGWVEGQIMQDVFKPSTPSYTEDIKFFG